MKKTILTMAILIVVCNNYAQEQIKWPGGRYALTCDGNMHDPDDICAIPMTIAMMCYAGFKDKIVHFDFANHLGLNHPQKLKEITESCNGVVDSFAINRAIFFNCQTELKKATANFVKEALRSSADNPLWLVCAGPMGTASIYLNAVKKKNPEKLQYIHCISHSNANNKHSDTPELEGKTWEAMQRDFPTVHYHDIKNQNKIDGFCSPIENWAWMKADDAPPMWKWLYSRNRTASVHVGKFDMSDGGMTYWLISGADQGGNESGNWDDIHALFKDEMHNK